MVSIAIIGLTALGVSRLFVSGAKGTKSMNQSSACVNHLNSVINRVRSMGTRVSIGDFLPPVGSSAVNRWVVHGTGTVLTEGSDSQGTAGVGDDVSDAIDVTHRFPPNATFNITNVPLPLQPVEVRTPHLINGIMGAMLAIYNSNTGTFCTNANGGIYNVDPLPNPPNTSQLSTLFDPGSNNQSLINLTTNIRVQPFSLSTGALAGCPGNLVIAPRGQPTSMATTMTTGRGGVLNNGLVPNGGVTWGGNVRNDVGLLVTLRSAYEDPNGVALGCTAEMRLQYPDDIGAPGAPTIEVARNTTWADQAVEIRSGESPTGPTTPSSAGINCADRDINSIELNIGFIAAGSNEAGTVLLCRDRSYVLPAPESAAASGYAAACLVGGVDTPNRAQYPPTAYFAPNTPGLPRPQWDATAWAVGGTVDVPYISGNGYVTMATVGTNTWVPCDQVQVCNAGPTASAATGPPASPTQKFYNLTFNNLPSGCVMQLDVRAMDTAGNLSALSTIDNTTVAAAANIVEFPRCGVWCGIGGAYTGGTGYFSCGGACP